MTTETATAPKRSRKAAAAAPAAAGQTLAVAVPVADPADGSYIASQSGHIDVRLEGAEARSFRRFHAGLLRDGAQLAGGRPVSSKADALRYLFGTLLSAESASGSSGPI